MLPPLQQLTTFLIDLDGVVYRGETLIPGAREFIHWLDAHDKKYLFLTNNSFASEQQVVDKLARLGIATDSTHVLGAAQAAVQNIAHCQPHAAVYIVGEPPLFEMVRNYDLQIANTDWRTADAVLVGLDRSFDYKKLNDAVQALKKGARFIAINRDPLLPLAGSLVAGCGAMVAALEASSEVTPEVIGKPEPALLREAMLRLQSSPADTIMIGDNLGVDIKAGIAADTRTMLVLSGKDDPASLALSPVKPDYIYEDLAAVMLELVGH
ncbi:MAG: HAD-IIA family hydrolase [Ktedonobacteraceae bacterium]